MIKTILTVILPFFGPFIAHFIWVQFVTKKYAGENNDKNQSIYKANNIAWCLLIGIILVALSLFFLGLNDTTRNIDDYTPPTVQDGKIQPGKF